MSSSPADSEANDSPTLELPPKLENEFPVEREIGSTQKRRTRQRQRQLIFDRRYGWIYDEWKSPAEVALAGGRGMFCILPLTKAMLSLAFQTIDDAADTVVQNFEKSFPAYLSKLNTLKEMKKGF